MCELFVKEQFLNSCSKDLAANYSAMSAEHLVTEHQIVLKGEVEEVRAASVLLQYAIGPATLSKITVALGL